MKKLVVFILFICTVLSNTALSHSEHLKLNIEEDSMQQQNHRIIMQDSMMGVMMQDPEIKKMIMEHMKKCRQEMMQKMMSNPKVVEKMMKMMLMHKDTVKKVLKNNPQMKKQLNELTK